MQVKFKCKCGARLRCLTSGIGQTLPCPGCSAKVAVPAPGESEVQRVLKKLPHAYPCKSSSDYLLLTQQIQANTAFNVKICDVTGHASLAFLCVDQAKRMLRNIAVFLEDADREPVAQASPATPIVMRLASLAAGQDFGGTGSADAAARQYRSWLDKQSDNQSDRNEVEHPLRGQVFSTIAALESLLT